jgi:hypothetical protein
VNVLPTNNTEIDRSNQLVVGYYGKHKANKKHPSGQPMIKSSKNAKFAV